MKKLGKSVWGWAMYDWANSAFATTVIAAFFPMFFKQYWSLGADVNLTTARLGAANSLASLAVALMAPVLGAIADRGSARKKFLIFFAYLGAAMTAALYLVGQGQWQWAMLVYAVANLGFMSANTFYDSLLPVVAGDGRVDFISGFGYALGYLGGGLLFLLNVIMVLQPGLFGLAGTASAVKLSFVSVAIWWGAFSLFTLVLVKEEPRPGDPRSTGNPVAAGFKQLGSTFRRVRHLKPLFIFLLAYWFYIDGVHTVIRMAVDYGMALGLEATDLIVAILLVQFVGLPAALFMGKLGEAWGVRRTLFLCLVIYALATIWAVLMSAQWEFYALAVSVGLVQGGTQALSRSYYCRMIPVGQSAEFYGFYNMLGKFAAILGPFLIGGAGLLARHLLTPPGAGPEQLAQVGVMASRISIASILILFVAGGILLALVDEKKTQAEAAYLSRAEP